MVTPGGADPEATTKVPCVVCGAGMLSAAAASRIREVLEAAGIDLACLRTPSSPP